MSTPTDGQETKRTVTAPGTAAMRRRTFVVGAGTAAAGATLGPGTAGSRESSERATSGGNDSPPRIIAHRGYAGLYPENTVGAAEAAPRGGNDDVAATRDADMIEIDVMPTGDGDVVVFRDSRLAERDGGERGLTDANGVVWETTTDVVTGAEVLESGETVPLLTDVLDAIPASVGANIEFKNPGSFDVEFAANLSGTHSRRRKTSGDRSPRTYSPSLMATRTTFSCRPSTRRRSRPYANSPNSRLRRYCGTRSRTVSISPGRTAPRRFIRRTT